MDSSRKISGEITDRIDVLAIGNAVVDVLVHASDDDLASYDLVKGGMTLIDAATAQHRYAALTPVTEMSGGSAANTAAGLALLGHDVSFIGKVRDDALGTVFHRDIADCGVRVLTPPTSEGPATARCLVWVTPDAERTMQTFLGASVHLGPDDIDESRVKAARILYLEGYLWDLAPSREAVIKAARAANTAKVQVAFSLSDAGLVNRHRQSLLEFITTHVGILFANHGEIEALGATPVAELCPVVVTTQGAKGSVVNQRQARYDIEPVYLDAAVDTTGAGDLYATGFLHALLQQRSWADCGRLGSLIAGEAVTHYGARPQRDLKALLGQHNRV